VTSVREALRAAGMGDESAAVCAAAFLQARAGWETLRSLGAPPRLLFVPGRIEVLGKHTDYAGGATLTCAVQRGACVVYSPRRDGLVRVLDTLVRARAECRLSATLAMRHGHWSSYPATVARRLARNFGAGLVGADIALHTTLPMSAGMSSSSALITATFLALAEINGLEHHPAYRAHIESAVDLASYLGSIENGQAFGTLEGDHGVGTFGGSEDHTAILCSEAGRVGHFAFRPGRRLGSLGVPPGHTFVVASSGIAATKTGNARDQYNRASLLVGDIVRRWCAITGRSDATLQDALCSSPDAADRVRRLLAAADDGPYSAADLQRRFEHFILENGELVPEAARALAAGDVSAFGAAADASQHAAEHLLGNQVPETVALARLARECGAAGASAFGAGFGGSVWALVEVASADRFTAAWREGYHRVAHPRAAARSVFFVSGAGPAAMRLAGASDPVEHGVGTPRHGGM
jgi:galactokinase